MEGKWREREIVGGGKMEGERDSGWSRESDDTHVELQLRQSGMQTIGVSV